MKTNRRSRCGGIASSLLVVVASFCAVSMTHAAPRPSMKELLATQELERQKAPFPLSVRIASVTVSEKAGHKGDVEDGWDSGDAFRDTLAQEFNDGLAYYLKGRGFKVSASKGGVVARVYIDRFTGRKGSEEFGGDLKATLVLRLNGKEVAWQPLSASVNYRDDKEERRSFAKEFSLEKVKFPTVLFYNLTVSMYDSIAEAILDANPDIDSGAAPAPVREAVLPARTSPPPPEPEALAPPPRIVEQPQPAPPPPRVVEQPPPAQQPPPRPTPPKVGIVTIESIPDAAEIYLDASLVATTPVKKLRLSAGDHIITIRKDGYADWVRGVRVLDDTDVTFKATLQRTEPDSPKPDEVEEEKLDQ